jgi:hypothetical protein
LTGDADRTDALDDGGALAMQKGPACKWEADMAACPETVGEGFTRGVESVGAIGKEGGELGGVGEVDEVVADRKAVGRRYRREARGNGGAKKGKEIK